MNLATLKEIYSLLSSRVIVIISGLLTSIITARYLGPEGNGLVAALTIYPSLFLTIGSLGIRQATTYYVGQEKFPIEKIYSSVIFIWFFTSIVCLIICYLLIENFTNEDYPGIYIFFAIVSIPFSLYNTYNSGVFLGKQNIREFNRINWVPAFSNFILSFLLLIVFKVGVVGAIIASSFGSLFFSFFLYNKIRKLRILNFSFDFKVIRGMLSLGITYAISLLIINLNYKIDIILLEKYSSSYELGIYSKGVGIIQYLWEIPVVLSTLVFSKSAGSKDGIAFSKKVCQLLRVSFIVIFFLSIVIYFTSNFIITLLYGKAFLPSGLILRTLIPGILLLTFFKVLNMDLAGKGKPWVAMYSMLPAVIINLVLNIVLIPDYGAFGASISSTISYAIAALIFLFIYSKVTTVSIKEIITLRKSDWSPVFSIVRKKVK